MRIDGDFASAYYKKLFADKRKQREEKQINERIKQIVGREVNKRKPPRRID